MKKRISGIIVVCEFFLVAIICLLNINWEQGKKSTTENRYLQSFPELFFENGKVNENFGEELDIWFKDNVGFRSQMIQISNIIQFNCFNTSTSENVEIGRDGWLFYNGSNNIEIAQGNYPEISEEQLATFCEKLVRVQERLDLQGREFVVMLPPSKTSIYPEYIQSGDYFVGESPADIVADYIECHSDIKVVRFKDVLLEHKEDNELLFFKTDSHWNARGRYVAYQQIINKFAEWQILNEEPVTAQFYKSGRYSGDLAGLMGAVNLNGQNFCEDMTEEVILSKNAVSYVTSGEYYNSFINMKNYQGVDGVCLITSNSQIPDGKKMLIYGDSMVGDCLLPYVGQHFAEIAFVRSYDFEQDMIDYINPDVVVIDISERMLGTVIPWAFEKYGDFEFHIEDNTLSVLYYDFGLYDEVMIPTWNETRNQMGVIWYKAERINDICWRIEVDINEYGSGKYIMHVYSGTEENLQYVTGGAYEVQ